MLNWRLATKRLANSWINAWTNIYSAVTTAVLWPDINEPKYVFIEEKDWIVQRRINLSDFIDNGKVGIHFLNDNIRDTPSKEITSYSNPFSNWWKILNKRYTEKEISLKLRVVAWNFYDLEATLLDFKNRLSNWWRLQINENGYLKYLDVILNDDWFEVDVDWWMWTKVDIDVLLLAIDPIKKSSIQTFYRWDQVWNETFAISILESNQNIEPNFKIVIKWVSDDTCTWLNIEYDNYTISYTWSLVEWDILEFDCSTWKCLLNQEEADFDWIINEITSWTQTPVSISFEWDWEVAYSLYILYYNLSL